MDRPGQEGIARFELEIGQAPAHVLALVLDRLRRRVAQLGQPGNVLARDGLLALLARLRALFRLASDHRDQVVHVLLRAPAVDPDRGGVLGAVELSHGLPAAAIRHLVARPGGEVLAGERRIQRLVGRGRPTLQLLTARAAGCHQSEEDADEAEAGRGHVAERRFGHRGSICRFCASGRRGAEKRRHVLRDHPPRGENVAQSVTSAGVQPSRSGLRRFLVGVGLPQLIVIPALPVTGRAEGRIWQHEPRRLRPLGVLHHGRSTCTRCPRRGNSRNRVVAGAWRGRFRTTRHTAACGIRRTSLRRPASARGGLPRPRSRRPDPRLRWRRAPIASRRVAERLAAKRPQPVGPAARPKVGPCSASRRRRDRGLGHGRSRWRSRCRLRWRCGRRVRFRLLRLGRRRRTRLRRRRRLDGQRRRLGRWLRGGGRRRGRRRRSGRFARAAADGQQENHRQRGGHGNSGDVGRVGLHRSAPLRWDSVWRYSNAAARGAATGSGLSKFGRLIRRRPPS